MADRVVRFALLLLCFFLILQSPAAFKEEEEDESVQVKKSSVTEMVKSLFSLTISSPLTSTYWSKVRKLIDLARGYYNTPDLDFRQGGDVARLREEGTGEKVKEVVLKSLDNGKAALEVSAKSAADITTRTAKKLHRTICGKTEDEQAEL